jgi:O-antigen ligase
MSDDAPPMESNPKDVADVLRSEYGMLMSAVTASWSVSMSRTSLFLGVLSAAGLGLGFAAQAGDGFGPEFSLFALVVLPITLFLGLATFVRQVQVQREVIVYIIGMNRIRRYFRDTVPGVAPHLVLATHDDDLSIYRSLGSGMSRRPPRIRFGYALVQTQGIVAVVCAVVAGAIAGIATTWLGWPPLATWLTAGVAFAVLAVILFVYWNRSVTDLQASIRPVYPTPPEQVDVPF